MQEKVLKCLYDIQLAITEIDSFMEMVPNQLEEYRNRPIVKRAVERNLEIIWAILHNHLPKLGKEVSDLISTAETGVS